MSRLVRLSLSIGRDFLLMVKGAAKQLSYCATARPPTPSKKALKALGKVKLVKEFTNAR